MLATDADTDTETDTGPGQGQRQYKDERLARQVTPFRRVGRHVPLFKFFTIIFAFYILRIVGFREVKLHLQIFPLIIKARKFGA